MNEVGVSVFILGSLYVNGPPPLSLLCFGFFHSLLHFDMFFKTNFCVFARLNTQTVSSKKSYEEENYIFPSSEEKTLHNGLE